MLTCGVFDILPVPYMNNAQYSENPRTFTISWQVAINFNWDSFELQENFNNGTWTTINDNITETSYSHTVAADGIYKYRVRAKINDTYYNDSWSGYINVPVGITSSLDFDGDDSFYVLDNRYDDLDVTDEWTFETWVKIDSYSSSDWSVIMDRRFAFSLYLIDDANADFAVRFAIRDGSDNIVNSLRSDNSTINLSFDEWFHVAVSFDGTTARMFVNGTLIEEKTSSDFVLTPHTTALNFAAKYWDSYSRYINGQLDEIRISNIARYTEIFCPVRFTTPQKDDNTILLFNLNNGADTYVYDASHNFLGIYLRTSPNTANWVTETCPFVYKTAENQSLCGGETNFSVISPNAIFYQWQENSGSGFSNISDNSTYSGTQEDTLFISNIAGLDGNIYRCMVTNNITSCSDHATLTVFPNCTEWDGSAWSNGLPNSTKSAVILGDLIVNSDLTAENLTITEDNSLTIQADNSFVVENAFENHGTLIASAEHNNLNTGAFLTKNSIVNYGEMFYKKFLPAPFSNPEYNFNLITTPIINNDVLIENIFSDEDTIFVIKENTSNWEQQNPERDIFNLGNAYLYQNTTTSQEIIELTGDFFNSDYNFSFVENDNNENWHLSFNPYATPINLNAETGLTSENLDLAIYTLNANNNGNCNQYSIFDGTVGIHGGSQYIRAGEGFFVKANDVTSTISMEKEIRVTNAEANSKSKEIDNLLRFRFENLAGQFDESVIYFAETENACLKPTSINQNSLNSFIYLNSNKYGIYKFAQNQPDTVVSVGFQCKTGGEFTFKIDEMNFSRIDLFFQDLLTGYEAYLTDDFEYTYTAGTSEPNNRFKIHFNYFVDIPSIEENNIRIFNYQNIIHIYLTNIENANYKIYDITGRLIKQNNITQTHTQIADIKNGIFFIQVKNEHNIKTTKVFLQ